MRVCFGTMGGSRDDNNKEAVDDSCIRGLTRYSRAAYMSRVAHCLIITEMPIETSEETEKSN